MRSFRLGVMLVAVALSAGGCGRGAEETTTTTTTDATSTTNVAETTTSTSASTSTTPTGGTAVTASGTPLDCGTVGFTPNSEDAASQIKATGLSCAEARAVLGAVGPRTSAEGPQELDVEGYHCTRTQVVQDPLPFSAYECKSGAKRITFVRS